MQTSGVQLKNTFMGQPAAIGRVRADAAATKIDTYGWDNFTGPEFTATSVVLEITKQLRVLSAIPSTEPRLTLGSGYIVITSAYVLSVF